MLGRVRVAGHSMEPALHHGDELLFLRIPPQVGSVVVARDPRDRDRLLVKRVAAIDGDDVILESDAEGHEGLVVERRAIIGRAILRYRPFFLPSRLSRQRDGSAKSTVPRH
ncbi:MAG: S26 family signal peptidase [Candidatus Limnocylindria bacterium]